MSDILQEIEAAYDMYRYAEEIGGSFDISYEEDDDTFEHSGVAHDENPPGRGSGRYPYGSGSDPFQHPKDFMQRLDGLKAEGITSDKDLAAAVGLSPTQLRTAQKVARDSLRYEKAAQAAKLKAEDKSLREIGKIMGVNESTVRSYLDQDRLRRTTAGMDAAEALKALVDERGMINVSKGANTQLDISTTQMKAALNILELQGYNTFPASVKTGPDHKTDLQILTPPGTPYKINVNEDGTEKKVSAYVYEHLGEVQPINIVSHDGGDTFDPKFVKPKSLDSKRLQVVYPEDGGAAKDGVIELRRGVEDISLGNSHYAQVRILVDDTHYLKGMAIYSDDLPDGVDVRFNTSKPSTTPVMGTDKNNTVLKIAKRGKDGELLENPFGSLVKEGIQDPDNPETLSKSGGQRYYYDADGNKQLSVINKTREEGDWEAWSDKLPAQFASKQSKQLYTRQINLSIADKKNEFKEIMELTNPILKQELLKEFADGCDEAAVKLQTASLPRQKYQVMLPLNKINDTEVYAPNYKDGETVALIRYPHGGQFEIPILTVNNSNKEGKKVIDNAQDAIGINSNVAARLSGADFDGDTVMVIPCNSSNSKVKINNRPPFRELVGFDPKMEYGGQPEGTFKPMRNTQNEMGKITNLISDMTILGATEDQLARAVKHSMVVIDAEKHGLDYQRSYRENGIAELRKEWLGHTTEDGKYSEGASTLITRAKSQTSIPKRQGQPHINQIGKKWYDPSLPEGALIYKMADDLYYEDAKKIKLKDSKGHVIKDDSGNDMYVINPKTGKPVWQKTGKIKMRTQQSTQMADTDDARTLISKDETRVEIEYARYANEMKSLATQARKEMVYTPTNRVNSEARKRYKAEVDSLDNSYMLALKNRPNEQMAQIRTNSKMKAFKADNPNVSKKDEKKMRQIILTAERAKVGAKRTPIEISDKEWEAIQAGAISNQRLRDIFNYVDKDQLKSRAIPRDSRTLSAATQAKIKTMAAAKNPNGSSKYSRAEIAEAAGVSTSTVSRYM